MSFNINVEEGAILEMTKDLHDQQVLPPDSRTEPWSWSKIPRLFVYYSIPYYINVFCFGKLGGYAICQKLFENISPTNLKFLNSILKGISRIAPCIDFEQWYKFLLPVLIYAAENFVIFIEKNDWKAIDQTQLKKFVNNLRIACHNRSDKITAPVNDKIDKIKIKLITKMFENHNEFLAINEIINLVENHRINMITNDNKISQNILSEPNELISWMKEQKIAELCLNEKNLNSEILAKFLASDFFGMLYSWQIINTTEILNILNFILLPKSDLDIKKGLLNIFNKLIPRVTESDAKNIFEIICSVKPNEIDENIISILISLIERELGLFPKKHIVTDDPQSGGILKYFYSLTHEEAIFSGLNIEIQKIIIDKFIQILKKSQGDVINYYIQKSVEFLEKDQSVFQFSKILLKVLEFPEAAKTREIIFKSNLIDKLIINLIRFKLLAVRKISELQKIPENSQIDLFEKIITSKSMNFNYYQELSIRINFIEFFLNYQINSERINLLCKSFIFSSVSNKEKEIIFEILVKLTKLKNVEIKIFEQLFYGILIKMNANSFTKNSFECFKNLFIQFNAYYKHIEIKAENFEILNSQLLGFSQLWELSLNSNEIYAIDFLIKIYQSFSISIIQQEGSKLRLNFIENCLSKLNSPITNFPLCCRALTLLTKYLDNFESKNSTQPEKHINIHKEFDGNSFYLDLKVAYCVNNFPWRSDITVRKNDSVEYVLKIMAQKANFDTDLSKLIFISNCGIIKPSSQKIIEMSGIHENTEIFVEPIKNNNIPRLKEMFQGKSDDICGIAFMKSGGDLSLATELLSNEIQIQEMESHMRELQNDSLTKMYQNVTDTMSSILSKKNEYFSKIYAFMNCGNEELMQKTAEFLKRIPYSQQMMESMSIGLLNIPMPIQWEIIFPSKSLYSLAYSLDLLKDILIKTYGENALTNPFLDKIFDRDQPEKWLDIFVKQGGFEYLLNVFLSLPEKEIQEGKNGPLIYCAENMLLIIKELGLQAFKYLNRPKIQNFMMHADQSSFDEKLFENNPEFKLQIFHMTGIAKLVDDIFTKNKMISRLMILVKTIAGENIKGHVLSICKYSLILIGGILVQDNKNYEELYSDKGFINFTLRILLNSDNIDIKQNIYKMLKAIFDTYRTFTVTRANIIPPDYFYLAAMLESLPPPLGLYPHCEQYFQLFIDLLPFLDIKEQQKLTIQVSNYLSERLKIQPVITDNKVDKLLAGYLIILSELVRKNNGLIIHADSAMKSFCDNIFIELKENTIKYSEFSASKEMMKMIYDFIIICAKNNKETRPLLLSKLCDFHFQQFSLPVNDPCYEQLSNITKKGPFIGLRNLGAICYINAVLQQFFMMPELRNSILCLPADLLPNTADTDKVLMHLQKIFSYLACSEKPYFSPAEFCRDFKWDNHKPIELGTQHDADEFFNILTDKMENELKTVGQKEMIRNLLEIKVCHEIQSLEPDKPSFSNIEEPCLTLNLVVKGKNSLEEALDELVKGDVMDGDNKYYCPTHKTKIKARNRCVIKSISQTLIIQLKRFDYNNATEMRKKLNEYFSFPNSLNFSKWSKDAKSPLLYNLVGVVVHSGYAEGGHYISLIKDRDQKSQTFNNWFEFDNMHIKPFSIGDMNKYYGKNNSSASNKNSIPNQNLNSPSTQNSNMEGIVNDEFEIHEGNAYILVYEKNIDNSKTDLLAKKLNEIIPQKYLELIRNENLAYAKGRRYIDSEYSNFIKDFCYLWKFNNENEEIENWNIPLDKMYIKSEQIATRKLAFLYSLDLFNKSKEATCFRELTLNYLNEIEKSQGFSRFIIQSLNERKSYLFEILIESRFEYARIHLQKIILAAISCLLGFIEKSGIDNEIIKAFITILLEEGFAHARSQFSRFSQYFTVLAGFIKSKSSLKMLIDQKIISKLIDFISNTPKSLINEKSGERPKMSELYVNFNEPLSLLYSIIKELPTSEMIEQKNFIDPKLSEITQILPNDEILLLLSPVWDFTGLVSHAYKSFVGILQHLCWESLGRTTNIISALVKAIVQKKSQRDYAKLLETLKEIILLKDTLFKERIEIALLEAKIPLHFDNLLDAIKSHKDAYEEFTVNCLFFISELGKDAELFEIMKKDILTKLIWVPRYLQGNPGDYKFMYGQTSSNLETKSKRNAIMKIFGELWKEQNKLKNAENKENTVENSNNQKKIEYGPWETKQEIIEDTDEFKPTLVYEPQNAINKPKSKNKEFELNEVKIVPSLSDEIKAEISKSQKIFLDKIAGFKPEIRKEDEKSQILNTAQESYKISVTNERKEKVTVINYNENPEKLPDIKICPEIKSELTRKFQETSSDPTQAKKLIPISESIKSNTGEKLVELAKNEKPTEEKKPSNYGTV